MAQQQGLPKTAQKVNLIAIQSLNSYVDGATTLEKGGTYPFSSYESGLMDIEFVMSFRKTGTKSANPTTSRRKVELQVPPPTMDPKRVTPHVQRQVVKLLRMADLPVPLLDYDEEGEEAAEAQRQMTDPNRQGGISEAYMGNQVLRQQQSSRKTAWDRSRDRFHARLNWKKYDQIYKQALHDAQAHQMTKDMIRNNPRARRLLLSKILSNIQFTDNVIPLERLVAYRRLLRLIDENFDELSIEDFGKYWEELSIVITEARPYNTSSSAMKKRRRRNLETGYSFTIHHDDSVTVTVPVDFQNDELVQELQRNVGDFYQWTLQDNSVESIFE
ncbi:unnamed protein product [Cylindrotheca closterium]|uniref:Uncharacterized protein n=1 Tax=Cylindrotheca closterium TaxID=2856 RepID=A0AAD2FFR7_9STRA|nr:unnamed protein product [Cylindrotheca closterium]